MKAILNTNFGTIEIELYSEKAPSTVENFIKYVNEGYYNGTVFHRVINEFMIQGGGFGEDMFQKATKFPAIKNEANNGFKNEKYTVAMARTMDPHSATSQFFINVKDNHFLNFVSEELNNWGYAVFGKVISGMDVVDKIKVVKTGRKNSHDDVPLTPVVILTATLDN